MKHNKTRYHIAEANTHSQKAYEQYLEWDGHLHP